VRGRHPQQAAGFEKGGQRQLAEPNAFPWRTGADHRAGSDAQGIGEIEHPGVRTSTPEAGGELANPGNDTERRAQSARTEGFIGGEPEAVGERLVARPALEAAEADLVDHYRGAGDRLVEPRS